MYTEGHKLRSKTRIVGNFNTERLQYIMGLFTWREEDPRRWNNFTLGLHAEISARELSK